MSTALLTLGAKTAGRDRKPTAQDAFGTNTETRQWSLVTSSLPLVAGEAVDFVLKANIQYVPFAVEVGFLELRFGVAAPGATSDDVAVLASSFAVEFTGASVQPTLSAGSMVAAKDGYLWIAAKFTKAPGISATGIKISIPAGLVPAGLENASVAKFSVIEAVSQGVPAGPAPVLVIA